MSNGVRGPCLWLVPLLRKGTGVYRRKLNTIWNKREKNSLFDLCIDHRGRNNLYTNCTISFLDYNP